MHIAISPYELHPIHHLNTCHSIPLKRVGALLKVQFDDQFIGFADCHPWPELGDESLTSQLHQLKQGKCTALTSCSIQLARIDAQARHLQKKCLSQKIQLISHFLIPDLSQWTLEKTQQLIQQKFTHVKIKIGIGTLQEINQLIHCFQYQPLSLRLDFNEKLSYQACQKFLNSIQCLQEQIDFIEDPCPFNPIEWSTLQCQGWKVACDRQFNQAIGYSKVAQVLIFKPAISSITQWKPSVNQRWVVTSYLDHPLGQVSAAYVASIIDPQQQAVHGLLSHYVYQSHTMSQKLTDKGPYFSSPQGFGWGFDQELAKLEWLPWN